MINIDSDLSQYQKTLKDPKEREYFSIHIDRYRHILRLIGKLNLSKGARILDIGCYPPHLFQLLESQGYSLSGISSLHEPLKKKGVIHLNIEQNPFPFSDDSFDLIIFTEVLEHLIGSPLNLFNEVKRVLKPSGIFLLTTPNVLRTQNVISLLSGRNIYFSLDQLKDSSPQTGSIYYRHNREFTQKEIVDLLEMAGLKTLSKGFFISYTPYRQKNKSDSLSLKAVKYLNFFAMKLFPRRQDTLIFLAAK